FTDVTQSRTVVERAGPLKALVAAASSLADGCLGSPSANADAGGDCGETGPLLPEKETASPGAAAVNGPNDPFDVRDAYGNRFPDFATCGFRAGSRLPSALPPVASTVCPASPCGGGDDAARIQSAIDAAGSLSPRGYFRGTVLLRAGIYRVSSSISVRHSGVVLRGEDGAVIIATGRSRRTLIAVGSDPAGRKLQPISKKVPVTDNHVPVGSRRLHIAERVPGLKVGDYLVVSRPGTSEWIHAIGMDAIPPRPDNGAPSTQWDAKKYGIEQERVVVGMGREPCGREYVDVEPGLAMDLRDTFGGGVVYKCAWTPTVPANMIGVENIKLVSEYELGRERDDEDHCTVGYFYCVLTGSEQDFADSGPHHRWATGILYDCVRVGGQLNCMNRSYLGTGHGWAGASFSLSRNHRGVGGGRGGAGERPASVLPGAARKEGLCGKAAQLSSVPMRPGAFHVYWNCECRYVLDGAFGFFCFLSSFFCFVFFATLAVLINKFLAVCSESQLANTG
ncbi:MAG: hypothetical protein BJ554DRAFT_4338, partial [Olpidium bornovanus]